MDGLDELVRHTLVVALLHGLHHVGGLLAGAADDEVVSLLHTLPALVAVHSVEAAHDAGDGGVVGGAYITHLLDKALARLRVGVAAIHITMYEELVLQAVSLTDFDELEEVVEAGVYAAVGGQTHQVQFLVVLLGIRVGSLHLRVLHDGAVLAGAVDFHQVLVDDASGTDVEVTHFGVTHLSVGQTDVLARGLQLRVS